MRYFSSDTQLPYSWVETASAYWRRYPSVYSRHVLSEDVLERTIDGPIMRTVRLLTKSNPMPRWGERFFHGLKQVLVVEESIFNLTNRTLTTYTRNIDYMSKRIMSVEERVVYRSPMLISRDVATASTAKTTTVHREAWVTGYVRGLVTLLEKFGIERYKHNASNARKGYMQVLEREYGSREQAHGSKVHEMIDRTKERVQKTIAATHTAQ